MMLIPVSTYRRHAIYLICTAMGGMRKHQKEAKHYELQHVLDGRDPAKIGLHEYTRRATNALIKLDPTMSYLHRPNYKNTTVKLTEGPITASPGGGYAAACEYAHARFAHMFASPIDDVVPLLGAWCEQRLREFDGSLLDEYAAYFITLLVYFIPFAGHKHTAVFEKTLNEKTPVLGYMFGLWKKSMGSCKWAEHFFLTAWKQHKHAPSGKLYADALYARGKFEEAIHIYLYVNDYQSIARCYYFGQGVSKQSIELTRMYIAEANNNQATQWLSALCASFEPTIESCPTVVFATRITITKTLSTGVFTAADVASMRLVCRAWNATILSNGTYWKEKRGLRVFKITNSANFMRVFFAQKHAKAVKSIDGRITTARKFIERHTALLGELVETQSKLKRHKR